MRVISLLPSATEIVCGLGLRASLVGRSHECDYPPGVDEVPAVSLARIPSERLRSAEIDRSVREAVADGGELYGIDEDLLERLHPDVVITQTLCRVCAVSGDGVRSALRVRGVAADVVELEPSTVDAVLATIAELGERLGARERALALVAGLRERLDDVEDALQDAPRRPRVFVAEWLDPPFAAGHWVPEMVDRAGGVEVLGRAGEPSYETTWDEVRAHAPEVVILAPCGFDVDRTLAELDGDSLAACLAGAPAIATGQVFAVDATSYFSRPGPRIVDGVELAAALLHPQDVRDTSPAGAWARVCVAA
jgi:iron complex transport system substrate-binding protein